MESLLTKEDHWKVIDEEEMDYDEENPSPFGIAEQRAKALAYIKLHLCDGPLLQTRNIRNPRAL